jgi:hypothetical protein
VAADGHGGPNATFAEQALEELMGKLFRNRREIRW